MHVSWASPSVHADITFGREVPRPPGGTMRSSHRIRKERVPRMGEFTTLMARDGHEFNAWLTAPKGPARGALVIAQEIFGVNHHIRGVADGFAADGYLTIAPCLFDRIRRGIELGYSEADTQ